METTHSIVSTARCRRRRFLIIHNPTAGMRNRLRFRRVLATLRKDGCEVVVRHALSLGENHALAESATKTGAFDAVVAAGGDGTVRAAATALLGSNLPLGIIPLGTGNVMAHEIGLEMRADAIANCLLDGNVLTIPSGIANGAPFFLMVGLGFDGRVVHRLNTNLKRRIGKLAYVGPVVGAIFAGLDTLRIRVDGIEHRATWAVVSSARHYAGAFVVAPTANLSEPGLQVVLFQAKSRYSLVAELIAVAMGRIQQRSDIFQLPNARLVCATAERPTPMQIDGEPFGSTPVEIRSDGPSLKLLGPCKQAEG